MEMPGRKFASGNQYRYGFNGKEKDKSTGEGNLDFGERIMDVRLGKWLSVDPLFGKYPSSSPYNVDLDNPITNLDPNGTFVIEGDKKEQKALRRMVKEIKRNFSNMDENSEQFKKFKLLSGFNSKKEAMEVFKDGKGPRLRFAGQNEEFDGPDGKMHLMEHNGNGYDGSSVYAYASASEIVFNRNTFETINNIFDVEKSKSMSGSFTVAGITSGQENNYIKDETNRAFGFMTRVMEHELTHYGAATHNMTTMVPLFSFSGGGFSLNWTERGNWYETQAYGKPIDWHSPESGVLTFQTYNLFKFGCSDRLQNANQCNHVPNSISLNKTQVKNYALRNYPQYFK